MDSRAAAGAVSVEIRDASRDGSGRAAARGVQSTLSKTSMLANFLPTGTLLAFEMLLPAASGDGSCSAVSAAMLMALLALCAASCFLFHFTDSFRAPDGKVYYGFVTPRGLWLFRTGPGVEVPREQGRSQEDRYQLSFVDIVHTIMSVLAFAAITPSDYRVSGCLLPGHRKEMDEVMESFPLMVGVACSGFLLEFPNARHSIGCMAA
ncbi:protein DMP9-like [Phragmites australis]|uniref:protein DMP9-like n=1 Tax=Phragmites australis TaxID=29695 RepID=UPI002D77B860|nr:protein DMP9-like [Phragmites australis]